MSASLDMPAPYYGDPGEDQRPMSIDEHVDAILAQISADRALTPDEMRPIQRLLAGIQQIGQMQQANAQGEPAGPMQDTPQNFGASDEAEPVDNGQEEGVENVQG